ncbi:MAG TPA: trigger factor [Steroidobacteraceae bacterium]|nr:trigger factor [Steroidobacteraceae bacterium]
MLVSVESIGALERRLEVSVPAGEVEQAVTARLKSFSRTARLKGFRPGKAPLAVVTRRFGPQIREEVVSELVRKTLGDALTEHQLAPVGGPRIEPLSTATGQDLKYAAVFEVYPTVELRGLDTIEVIRPTADVGPKDVDAMIENLRSQRLNYVPATRPAADGDRATVDFEGRIDGAPFEGSTGQGVPVILGAGRMLKDFEAGLKGTGAGATVTVPVEFPADYGKAELAGRTAEFTIAIKSVEEGQLPPLDAAFCEAFGVTDGGIEQLRREVEDNMRRELADNIRARVRTQLLDKLLAANPFEVPRVAVENQIRALQVDWLRRIGAKPEDLKQAPPREPFEEGAKRRVALGLLVREIVRQGHFAIDAHTFEERIEVAAAGYADPEAAARQIRGSEQLRSQLEAGVLEDQAVDWLLGRVKVIEQPSTFKELMNFGA